MVSDRTALAPVISITAMGQSKSRPCTYCGGTMRVDREEKLYCSAACKQAAYRKRKREAA